MNRNVYIRTDLGACNRAKMCEIPKLFLEEEKSSVGAAIKMSDGTTTTAKNALGTAVQYTLYLHAFKSCSSGL